MQQLRLSKTFAFALPGERAPGPRQALLGSADLCIYLLINN